MEVRPETKALIGPVVLGAGLGLAVGAAYDSWIIGVATAILAFAAFLLASRMS